MKDLTTGELMDMIAGSLREMHNLDVTDARLSNAINRTKATAMGSQAAIKVAQFDAKHNTPKSVESRTLLLTDKGKR